jgi:hypothetical protein
MLLGWLIPNSNYLKFYIIFNISIILHWILNNNNCILSEMDNKEKGVYTSKILQQIYINIDNNSIFIDIINYGLIIILTLIAYYRILKMSYKKSKKY